MFDPLTILRDNAGARMSRVCRATRTTVTLYNAEEANLDTEDGKWATVCEDHGSIASHRSFKTAVSWLPSPHDWCEECRAYVDKKTEWEAK